MCQTQPELKPRLSYSSLLLAFSTSYIVAPVYPPVSSTYTVIFPKGRVHAFVFIFILVTPGTSTEPDV